MPDNKIDIGTVLSPLPRRGKRLHLWALLTIGLLIAEALPAQPGQAPARGANRPMPSRSGEDQDLLPGLVGTYSDRNQRLTLVVPNPNFYLQPDESAHPSLAAAFEAEWTGLISILQTGDYTFECAAEVSVNGEGAGNRLVHLESGRYPIRIRFRRGPGQAKVLLRWKSNHFPLEPVPSSLLWHPASSSPGREDMLVERGRRLVEEFGCVNCHATDSPSLQRRVGPDLTGVGSRTNARWLFKWLENASAYRAGAVMPDMLDDQQRRDVASYLSSLAGKGRLRPAEKPSGEHINLGRQLYESLGCAACHQQEGLSLEGIGSKTAVAPLAAYLRDPARTDPSGRMPSMMLDEDETFQLAAFLVESRNPAFGQPLTGGDPVRGKALVRSEGCLACHALDDPSRLVGGRQAPRLERLSPDRGCLSSDPQGVPRYRLTGDQRGAMQAFLRSYRQHPDLSRAPVYEFRRTGERLRCVSCHQVDDLGPAKALPEAVPPLTDAGAKLRTGWLEQVMVNRKRVRRWLKIRMPHYDAVYVKPMVDGFARASGVEPGDGPAATRAAEAERARGVDMIGTNAKAGGMGCIGCHDWGAYKSLGEDGPQLINVADRLRYDWYRRWMLNPARILSGTTMPNFFSSTEPRRAEEMVRTLWAALSMGETMPLPEGFRTPEAALGSEERPVPDRQPIVIRWDMPESTAAAIAVGFPGKISYCFDAGESRLRYAWEGGFVDMSGTLLRKVDENRLTPTAKPIGEIFYRSDEFPLRIGTLERIPQRRFRGYRLIDHYPQFHYQVDGIDVYERIVPANGNQGLTREFTIDRVDRPMWFLTGRGEGGVVTSTIGAIQDGRLPIPRGTRVRFDVTIVKKKAN